MIIYLLLGKYEVNPILKARKFTVLISESKAITAFRVVSSEKLFHLVLILINL